MSNPERNDAKDAKGTIEQPPEEGNAPDRPADHGQRNDQDTGDHSKLDNPHVLDRILQGAQEGYGDHEVGKCQPIGAVEKEWVLLICLGEPLVDERDPISQRRPEVLHEGARADRLL